MITCYIDHTGTTFTVAQDSAYYVGVALFPTPFILLYLPGIYDISYEIECVAGIVFEKVVEFLGLAVFGAEVYV